MANFIIPKSFLAAGFGPPPTRKYKRLLIGTEGVTNSGKTEFMLSAPGPGIIIAVDPTYEGNLDNPRPPAARKGHLIQDIKIPMSQMGAQSLGKPLHDKVYKDLQDMSKDYWNDYRDKTYAACDLPEALTVGLDGDGDTWNLQKLAHFGRIEQILPRATGPIKDVRRVFIYRMFQSGKNIIASSKLKAKYVDTYEADGVTVKLDKQGEPVREKHPSALERVGYPEDIQDYLWQFQIRHLYQPPTEKVATMGINKGKVVKTPGQWGLRILKCKHDVELIGAELWGEDCNFEGLVAFCFPNTDPSEWGL